MSWATSPIWRRKGHLAHHLEGSHVKGIGGPGAPHVFRLERLSDTGTTLLLCFMLVCVWMSCTWKIVLCSIWMFDIWVCFKFCISVINVVWQSSSKILILSHVPTRRTFLQRLAHQVLATQGSPTKPVWLCLEDYLLKFTWLGYIWIMVHIIVIHILYVLQLGRYYHTLLLKLHNLRFKLQRQHKFSHKSSQDQTIHERSWIPKHKVLVHASIESAGAGRSTPSTRQDHDCNLISNCKISHVFSSCQSTSKTQSTQTATRTRLCESMQTHCAKTLEQWFFLNYDLLSFPKLSV